MGLPYRLVLTLACIVLAVRYQFESDAPATGRWIVGLATATSFVLPTGLVWYIAGIGIQLGVSLFVLLHLKATAH